MSSTTSGSTGPSKRTPIADSVLLGGFALALATISVVILLTGTPLVSKLGEIAFTMGGATPMLFLLNLVISYRDERRGLRQQGRRGLILSGLAVVVASAPLFLAN